MDKEQHREWHSKAHDYLTRLLTDWYDGALSHQVSIKRSNEKSTVHAFFKWSAEQVDEPDHVHYYLEKDNG